LICHVLDGSRKYVKVNKDMRFLPDESEQELLDRWCEAVRPGEVRCTSNWQNYLKDSGFNEIRVCGW
jgi:hypothetical protein